MSQFLCFFCFLANITNRSSSRSHKCLVPGRVQGGPMSAARDNICGMSGRGARALQG